MPDSAGRQLIPKAKVAAEKPRFVMLQGSSATKEWPQAKGKGDKKGSSSIPIGKGSNKGLKGHKKGKADPEYANTSAQYTTGGKGDKNKGFRKAKSENVFTKGGRADTGIEGEERDYRGHPDYEEPVSEDELLATKDWRKDYEGREVPVGVSPKPQWQATRELYRKVLREKAPITRQRKTFIQPKGDRTRQKIICLPQWPLKAKYDRLEGKYVAAKWDKVMLTEADCLSSIGAMYTRREELQQLQGSNGYEIDITAESFCSYAGLAPDDFSELPVWNVGRTEFSEDNEADLEWFRREVAKEAAQVQQVKVEPTIQPEEKDGGAVSVDTGISEEVKEEPLGTPTETATEALAAPDGVAEADEEATAPLAAPAGVAEADEEATAPTTTAELTEQRFQELLSRETQPPTKWTLVGEIPQAGPWQEIVTVPRHHLPQYPLLGTIFRPYLSADGCRRCVSTCIRVRYYNEDFLFLQLELPDHLKVMTPDKLSQELINEPLWIESADTSLVITDDLVLFSTSEEAAIIDTGATQTILTAEDAEKLWRSGELSEIALEPKTFSVANGRKLVTATTGMLQKAGLNPHKAYIAEATSGLSRSLIGAPALVNGVLKMGDQPELRSNDGQSIRLQRSKTGHLMMNLNEDVTAATEAADITDVNNSVSSHSSDLVQQARSLLAARKDKRAGH